VVEGASGIPPWGNAGIGCCLDRDPRRHGRGDASCDIKASVNARISAHVDVYIEVSGGTQPEDGIGSIQLSISSDVPN